MNGKAQMANSPENYAFNCSQKVFSAFCEDYGIERDMGLRISGALGGGLRIGETCGALIAALLVVGLKYSTVNPSDEVAKALCDEKEREVSASFREIYGSITCRDILGIDTSIGNNRSIAKDMGLFKNVCPGIIERSIELLEGLGY